VYVEGPFDLTEAVRREFQLKRWSRAKKLALIRGDAHTLHALSRSGD
jgi:predicted GIY-YIG superfamily endonuclease